MYADFIEFRLNALAVFQRILQQYPWHFELLVHFSLIDSGIEIHYEVINKDEKPMLFTIGSHPAFALDINEPTELENYTITVDQSESLQHYSLNDSNYWVKLPSLMTM